MTFELEVDGIHLRCSSPMWTARLLERGARLIDPAQAELLRSAVGDAGGPVEVEPPVAREG